MPDTQPHGSLVFITLLLFLAGSVWLGTLAQRSIRSGKFLEGFFLGNRGLGAWTLALTATVQSGGTFMGYPSLVYSHGWAGLLWISAYMVVPLTGFALVGKRVAQLSRRTDAITVPELFAKRFDSPLVGLVASILIIYFLSFTMCAQFKAGAVIMKLAWPGEGFFGFSETAEVTADTRYLMGLLVFAITVIGYTMIGGFLASVWTDLFQSVLMVIGVVVLLGLAVPAAGGMEQATRTALTHTGDNYAFGPGFSDTGRAFLPISLAFSMFFVWVYAGAASPASVIRLMAAQNTEVLRKSIALLALYNCLIYVPLAMIAICGRALIPHLGKRSDEIIPLLAMQLTAEIPGGSLLTALILSAPFGAIMASVSCFVLVIASGLVQDLYLRFVKPSASPREIRIVTRLAMVAVGTVGVLSVVWPPNFLQALVVFSSSAGASTLVVPTFMACYWRRSSATGTLAAMLAGFTTYNVLFGLGVIQSWAWKQPEEPWARAVIGWLGNDTGLGLATAFRPLYLGGLDPMLWGLMASACAGIVVSRSTAPPPAEHVARLFDRV